MVKGHGVDAETAEHRRAHSTPKPSLISQLINLEGQMGSQRGHRRGRRASVDLK